MERHERHKLAVNLLQTLAPLYGLGVDNGEWADSAEQLITDTLSDLRHACDLKSLDFAELDEQAQRHYVSEVWG